ncbi:unnamed protein product, partial [Prorocentrum cordatum]
ATCHGRPAGHGAGVLPDGLGPGRFRRGDGGVDDRGAAALPAPHPQREAPASPSGAGPQWLAQFVSTADAPATAALGGDGGCGLAHLDELAQHGRIRGAGLPRVPQAVGGLSTCPRRERCKVGPSWQDGRDGRVGPGGRPRVLARAARAGAQRACRHQPLELQARRRTLDGQPGPDGAGAAEGAPVLVHPPPWEGLARLALGGSLDSGSEGEGEMDVGQVVKKVRETDAHAAADQGPSDTGRTVRRSGIREAVGADRAHVREGLLPAGGPVARRARRACG